MEEYGGVRALTQQQLGQAVELYRALGRDGAWALDEEACPLPVLAGGGQVWGAFAEDGTPGAVCAVVSAGSALPQARAMAAGLRGLAAPGRPFPGRAVALPAAWRPGPAGEKALRALAAALAGHGLWGALAVKPVLAGPQPLAAALAGGLTLRRIRPLCSLRPHYLLGPAAGPGTLDGHRIILMYEDTRALGRLLEDGWQGVECRKARGGTELVLARPCAAPCSHERSGKP